MYIFTPQEAGIVGNSRESIQLSTACVVFLWRPIKIPLVCGFFPPLLMITLKNPLPLCSSRSHKYNNYDKTTHILSSNLRLFTCSQATGFPWNLYPQRHRYYGKEGVSQIHPPVSGVNFSNNISVPQVWVNIKKIEHDTTFEI